VIRQRPSGYTPNWGLMAIAVCADPPQGYEAQSQPTGLSIGSHSVAQKFCTGSAKALSAGGYVSVADPHMTLSDIALLLAGAQADAYENMPADPLGRWFVVAQVICANTTSGWPPTGCESPAGNPRHSPGVPAFCQAGRAGLKTCSVTRWLLYAYTCHCSLAPRPVGRLTWTYSADLARQR
jgi:hypothetical protein